MLSYSRLFNISNKWQFRVGPATGITGIMASDEYTDDFEKEVEGLPEPETTSKSTYKVGLLTGFRWNFSKRGSMDINYLIAKQGRIIFDEMEKDILGEPITLDRMKFGAMSHRFNVTVGWRIGTKKQ